MKTEHTTRLYAYVARDVRKAVVLRRGPSKQVRIIAWDLATDEFDRGQWLSGRLYNERCDISPNGRLFVYFAGKFKTELGTFTAVCRPPNFTALALWPEGSTWGGGGFFESDRRLVMNYARVIEELNDGASIPDHFEVTHAVEFRERYGEHHPIANQGWELVTVGKEGEPPQAESMRYWFVEPWVHRKACPGRSKLSLERRWLGMFEVNGPSSVHDYALVEGDERRELGRLDWAGWDHDGSLLFSREGKMFRQTIAKLRHPSPDALELADFHEERFENILPRPDAKTWPR